MRFLSWLNKPLQPRLHWRIVFMALLCALLLLFFRKPLMLELWNDELYSFLFFQRVPMLQTVTDYHETNNHVLYNLIQNLWIRITGNSELSWYLERPWLLRVPTFIYSLVSCVTLGSGLLRRYGPGIAVLGLTLLLTSIPYFNFAMQGRAYGLLIMVGTLQLFGFLSYQERGGARRLWVQAVWAFMLFYAHPAGLYLGIGWILATLICFSRNLQRPDMSRQRAYYACGAWICGLMLAGFAYLPIMQQILHNPWVGTKTVTLRSFITDTFVSVLRQLVSGHLWLLVLALIGILITRILRHATAERRILMYCLAICFGCYLMPLLRLDAAPQRTFVMLIPYIVTGLTIAIAAIVKGWKGIAVVRLAPLVLAVISAVQFPFDVRKRDRIIEQGIRDGVELSSIGNAYYLHAFNPLEIVRKAQLAHKSSGLPVYAAIAYRQEMPHYLEISGLPWMEYRSPEQRAAVPEKALIITSMLPEFRRRYAADLDYRIVDSSGGFYELLEVRWRGIPANSNVNP
jgi:hypothetical protein